MTAPPPAKKQKTSKTNLGNAASSSARNKIVDSSPSPLEAKKFAVEQVQKEGCVGNFRSFDSPFGNYLVPVIPTRADLLG